MTLCVYPDDCRAPATVDVFCEHHWWLVEAEVAEFRSTLTERDEIQGSSAVRPGAIRKDVLPSRSVSGPAAFDARFYRELWQRKIEESRYPSRSVSVDHDPGDCGCEDCR